MNELIVISGKGGTGKTSITASFAVLANNPVLADCDVDAADLHLLVNPDVQERHEFRSGHKAFIRTEDCVACGACLTHCRFGAVQECLPGDTEDMCYLPPEVCNDCDFCRRSCTVKVHEMLAGMQSSVGLMTKPGYRVDPVLCEGCGVCRHVCPNDAITMYEAVAGEWYCSSTPYGPMVHACLGVAAENSGKLVSLVRKEARRIARESNRTLVLVDGPPGIGCPVIASITGASLVLIVTEPTPSGKHDLERVLSLAQHFRVPVATCVNKWDINPALTESIETLVIEQGGKITGRVRYDGTVTEAQRQAKPVVLCDCPSADDIKNVWLNIKDVARQYGIEYEAATHNLQES